MRRLLVAVLFLLLMTCTRAWSLTPDCGRVQALAEAIARTEGFYDGNTLPHRYHNPGDIRYIAGYKFPGQVRIGKGGHIVFKNDRAGWQALRRQIEQILSGESHHYTIDMTLGQMGKKYAENWRLWSHNLSHNLGVPVTTTLREYFGIPKTQELAWKFQ